MKKIIPLLFVVIMVVSFAVPAFAVIAVPNGPFKFIDSWEKPSTYKHYDFPEGVLMTYDGKSVSTIRIGSLNGFTTNSLVMWFHDGSYEHPYQNGEWVNTELQYLKFTQDYTPSTDSLYTYFMSVVELGITPPEKICDGSSCSWADDNYDEICDTCGLRLSNFVYNVDLLEYANDQIVHARDTWPDAIYWFISSTDDENSLYAYISESPFVYENGVLSTPVMCYWATFSLNQQGRPISSGWSHINADSPLIYYDLIDSSTNIDGFFPPLEENPGTGDGGDTTTPGDDTENDGVLDGLRDIFTRMLDNLKGIAEGISNLPTLIGDKIGEALNTVKDGILEGIKSIFIPDTDYIETAFNSFLDELKMKFTFDTDMFESLFDSEQPVEDVYVDLDIPGVGAFNLKVLDTSFFVDGVTYFRPFIRGFLVLLLMLFHVKQFIGFFGYDSGVVVGRSDSIAADKRAQVEGVFDDR